MKARIVELLRDPTRSAGYALALNAMLTGGLGLVFWFAAARLYDEDALGLAAAAISAVTLVANLANLGMKTALLSFLPTAGRSGPSLVAKSYLAAGAAALAGGALFLAGQPLWAGELGFLRSGVLAPVGFTLFCIVWVIFLLQDSVLTATRRSGWVPAENAIYGVAKGVALIALASALSVWGVILAWFVPVVLIVVVVNSFAWSGLRGDADRPGRQPTLREVAAFAGPEHVASTLWLTLNSVMPIIILERLGPAESGRFFLALSVAYGLYLITSAFGSAVVAEASRSPEQIMRFQRLLLRNASMVIIPGAIVLTAFAPLILRVFGSEYIQATTTLRLLTLSAIPNIVVGIGVATARVERQPVRLIPLYGTIASITVGGTLLLDGSFGLTGSGIAWLLAQCTVAAALLATTLRPLVLSLFPHSSDEVMHAVRSLRNRWKSRERDAGLVSAVRAELYSPPARIEILRSINDVLVLRCGEQNEHIVRIARTVAGERALQHHANALHTLVQRLPAELRTVIPRPIGFGTLEKGQPWVAEESMPGTVATTNDGQAILMWANTLHRAEATTQRLNRAHLEALVMKPLGLLTEAVDASLHPHVEALGRELCAELDGAEVTMSRIHGDLCLDNVLLHDGEICAVIDWERTAQSLPEIDLAHLGLTIRAARAGSELGVVVVDALGDPARFAAEQGLEGSSLGTRSVITLAWLHHIANNLEKSERYGSSPVWIRRNLETVLLLSPAVPA